MNNTCRHISEPAQPKLSTYWFCHGDPGSVYAFRAFENRDQSRSALAVISGPLPQCRKAGAVPRSAWSRSGSPP